VGLSCSLPTQPLLETFNKQPTQGNNTSQTHSPFFFVLRANTGGLLKLMGYNITLQGMDE